MFLLVDLPAATELSQRPVPVIERFLDRRGSGWNMPSMSTVVGPSGDRDADFVVEYMHLTPSAEGRMLMPIVRGGPLEFSAAPGTFADDPEEEDT